jgi:hypothetical protein
VNAPDPKADEEIFQGGLKKIAGLRRLGHNRNYLTQERLTGLTE